METSDKKPFGFIYLLICVPVGLSYVGQTTRTVEERWDEHKSTKSKGCRKLNNHIRKYGWDSFQRCILATADNLDDLNRLETEFILSLGTLSPGGLNLTTGGKNKGRHSEETRQRLRQVNGSPEARQRNSERGKKRFEDPEERLKQGECQKKRFTDTEERLKLSESRKRYFLDPEARQRQSVLTRTQFLNPDFRSRVLEGRRHYFINNPEAGRIHSERMKEYYSDPEARKRHSESMKKSAANKAVLLRMAETNSKSYVVTFPDGHEESVVNMARFCRENNLTSTNMIRVAKGRTVQHKQFRCRYA